MMSPDPQRWNSNGDPGVWFVADPHVMYSHPNLPTLQGQARRMRAKAVRSRRHGKMWLLHGGRYERWSDVGFGQNLVRHVGRFPDWDCCKGSAPVEACSIRRVQFYDACPNCEGQESQVAALKFSWCAINHVEVCSESSGISGSNGSLALAFWFQIGSVVQSRDGQETELKESLRDLRAPGCLGDADLAFPEEVGNW